MYSFDFFLIESFCVKDIEFKEGEKEHWVEIDILYDGQREMREAFTVHLKPDDNMVAEIQVTQRPNHASKHKPVVYWSCWPCMCSAAYLHTCTLSWQPVRK